MDSIKLFDLPDIAIKKIFSYLPFEEVSCLRIVNRDFNQVGKEVLNSGLARLEKFHSMCLKEVRTQLPRRESERRTHPLARHVDVFTAIETRLSMLSMTYAKYIDSELTCFIPGKVLDEVYRVIREVRGSECPPRPIEVLKELRDITSMAVEHFDEKIAPELKSKLNFRLLLNKYMSESTEPHCSIISSEQNEEYEPHQLSAEDLRNLLEVNRSMGRTDQDDVMREVKALKSKVVKQQKKLVKQGVQIRELTAKLAEQNTQLAEMRRLLDEYGLQQQRGVDTPSTSGLAELGSKNPPQDCKRKDNSAEEISGRKKRKL